ncbi:DNA polymerase III subunit chi [Vibrio sp. UCD-FRSSP16_10]|uniref:DNA polymerase III subunit chi n=1 Tax=unclassified Vibrio TaxID=2614977 RepID=UPI0007FCC8E2|nr:MULTISPECIES: DNA polymerase III subunit chi [unclassified Vibrio]OBT17399.1 DNA polymerase III subunit chi [Vibrio sp. UCD-FRSSP16_30]OBT23168.1 DNA polymerase III subunit chi [Vibrio sp. UCD-FRSSP16_10]
MSVATFYLIEPNSIADSKQGFQSYVCYLIKHFTQQGARIYLNAKDKQDAEQWDEFLFQLSEADFIAHNLSGEGPWNCTAVEIGSGNTNLHRTRNIVINLAEDDTNFAGIVSQVVDFVPCDEKAKHIARERYKIYRQAGYEMQTITIAESAK